MRKYTRKKKITTVRVTTFELTVILTNVITITEPTV